MSIENVEKEAFKPDGEFLVVLRLRINSIIVKYKTAVPFTGGCATLEYDEMETAPNSYTVTFHTNGGTPADFIQQVKSGGKATIPHNNRRGEEGYTLEGWYTATDYAEKWVFDINTVKGDTKLYAKWTRNTYKVTFDTGGIKPIHKLQTVQSYGDKVSAPQIRRRAPPSTAGTRKRIKRQSGTSARTSLWKQIKYTVTFNTGAGGSIVPALEVPHGSAVWRKSLRDFAV
jgi:uncharacterized repeat protein (TIGR02543 family)